VNIANIVGLWNRFGEHMPEKIQVYWSFRSPYSYLVTPDLLQLRNDFEIDIELKVVLPIAVRSKTAVFDTSNKNKFSYTLLDVMRRAEYLGRPISLPTPDPIVQNMETFELGSEQPYIFWLCKLGVEANRQGRGIDFAASVSRLIWGGTKNWLAAEEAGLDLAQMEKLIESYDHLKEIEQNHESLDQAGHWGVPTLVVRGEPFFGQDRIKTLEWRLEKLGLTKNALT